MDTIFHLAALDRDPIFVCRARALRAGPTSRARLRCSRPPGRRECGESFTLRRRETSVRPSTNRWTNRIRSSPSPHTRRRRSLQISSPESYCQFVRHARDDPLHPFNTFGPRQSVRAVLPTLMIQALYADRIVVGALDPIRDMNVRVQIPSTRFLRVGEADDVEGELFNVGSGYRPHDCRDVAADPAGSREWTSR